MKRQLIILSCLLGLFVIQFAGAADLSIQQRIAKLERQMKQQPTDNRSNSADLAIQIQALQQQIAELKGVLEEQIHQINSLKEKQKLLYIDIDSRLTELESSSTGSSTMSSPANNPESSTEQPLTVEVDENYNTANARTTGIIDEPKLSSYQDDYDIAFAHLRAGRFGESSRSFENFIHNYPDSELTDNAYYWLGESYYVKRQYPQALAAFQSLTKKFPKSSKAPDSWLKIGYSYYEMDDLAKADENLQKVIKSYPNTSLARLAKNRLRQLQRDH